MAGAKPLRVDDVMALLHGKATKKTRDGLARFAIDAPTALGVSVTDLRKLAKSLGRDHDLAQGLWATGIFDARMLACFLAEPGKVSPALMDAWCKTFDNWAIVDTACFVLFDKTPHAWKKVATWAKRVREFERRAAFALLASLTVHDKKAPDEPYRAALALIDDAADDDRNFVKKAVNWALRSIGKRSPALHADAMALAEQLADSDDSTRRWVGKDAIRDLRSPASQRRLAKQKKSRVKGQE